MDHQSTKAIQTLEKLPRASYQMRVYAWLIACFGQAVTFDRMQRNHRFLEEALELVRSLGCTREDAHILVDFEYDRKAGDPQQEVGGSLLTLAAICVANGYNLEDLGEIELARAWGRIEQIREKQKEKPFNSPLPGKYKESKIPVSVCEHADYSFDLHGGHCHKCGAWMVERGD